MGRHAKQDPADRVLSRSIIVVWIVYAICLFAALAGDARSQTCVPGSTAPLTICPAAPLQSGLGIIEATWCSNLQQLEVYATTPAPSIGYAVTGPTYLYQHVAYIKGNLCVGPPQFRHVQQAWVSQTGNPIRLLLDVGPHLRGDTIYVQGYWRDYSDGREAFTNAQRVVVL